MFFGARQKDEGHGCMGHHPRMMHAGHMTGSIRDELHSMGFSTTRRFLRPVVLLLLAEQPMHGYELMGRLKEFGIGRGGMDPSLLYRLLRVLERTGLAESTLDDTGAGPARKVYSLTPEGLEVLDLWVANLDEIFSFLQEFKERYENLSSPSKG